MLRTDVREVGSVRLWVLFACVVCVAGCGAGNHTGADGGGRDGDAASGDGANSDGDGGGPSDGALCTVTASPQPFQHPSLEYHWRGAHNPFPTFENVCATPVVAPIQPTPPDADPVPDIVFVTFDCATNQGVLRVISGRAPHTLLWSQNGLGAPNDTSAAFALRWDGHPAAGDLDGNLSNGLEIVAITDGFGLVAYHSDGTVYWSTPAAMSAPPAPEENPAVSIADIDGNGVPEVIFGATVVDGRTGAVIWRATTTAAGANGQGPLSIVSDLDNDGLDEVIAGGTVYNHDGTVRFMLGDGFSAVGDILNASGAPGRDGVPEIARVSAGVLYLHDGHTGMMRWSGHIVGAVGPGGAPTIADFNGDGNAEIGVAGADHYTVFAPGCTATMPHCLSAGVLWASPTQDTSSAVTSSTVFDFNADGTAEVVYNDEDRFMVFDGPTGRLEFYDWNPSQTRTEQPIAADVDADGHTEIVFGGNICATWAGSTIPAAMQSTQRVPGLEIWGSSDGTWVRSRSIWNEHAYHIDNVNDDGSIPMHETPSWTTHNTFRLNRAFDDPLLAPDLVAQPQMVSCTSGTAHVCVNVSDVGSAAAGPVDVGFYDHDPSMGAMPIATTVTTRSVTLAGSQPACVDIPAPSSSETIWVRVNDNGSIRECNAGNDVIMVTVMCGPG